MTSYGKFQSDNKKYGMRNRDNYNPAFNPTLKSKGSTQQTSFEKNMDKYVYFVAWARWFPDLFLDLVAPKEGRLNLNPDQRVFMRIIFRYQSVYGVFPRGWSKTMLEVFGLELCAIFFPGIDLALTAQTKESAAALLESKHRELMKFYPILQNEVLKTNFGKNAAEIPFVNNSIIDVLPNSANAKGQRRRRINVEESALLNNEVFEDALKPIVNISRTTVGKTAMIDPQEMNNQINFFTTSGFRGSEEYLRSLNMYKSMKRCEGVIVLGADWHLASWFGRGLSKSDILKEKEDCSPIFFAQNYESRWVGNSNDALVNINKLLNTRSLETPESEGDWDEEYYLGVDVARSVRSGNNITAIAPIRILRTSAGKIKKFQLTNIIEVSGNLNFTAQSVEVKKAKIKYNAKVVCVDTNGLGIGLHDELLKINTDINTGEEYPSWNTLNTDVQPEKEGAERCIYDLKPQSANTQVITSFIDCVDSGKLQLLIQKAKSEYSIEDMENKRGNVLPFLLTDSLIEEITNLKLEVLSGGKLAIKKLSSKYDKDKFSALQYVLWYVKTFEENVVQKEDNIDALLACIIM